MHMLLLLTRRYFSPSSDKRSTAEAASSGGKGMDSGARQIWGGALTATPGPSQISSRDLLEPRFLHVCDTESLCDRLL